MCKEVIHMIIFLPLSPCRVFPQPGYRQSLKLVVIIGYKARAFDVKTMVNVIFRKYKLVLDEWIVNARVCVEVLLCVKVWFTIDVLNVLIHA